MPMKKEATDLINNRFFQLLKQEIEGEYFEDWQNSESVQDREDVYLNCKAFNRLIERIEHEAEQYSPPQLGAA